MFFLKQRTWTQFYPLFAIGTNRSTLLHFILRVIPRSVTLINQNVNNRVRVWIFRRRKIIEFVDELALSVDFAQSYNSNFVLLGDYNPNYLNTEDKGSLDTNLTLYKIEVVNKLRPTHSKTLIDYITTGLNSTELKKKVLNFTPPIKTDHLATILISNLKIVDKTVPFKRTIYDRSNF